MRIRTALSLLSLTSIAACERVETVNPMNEMVAKYAMVPLATDQSVLSENERAMLPLLIEASRYMDELFWRQAYGDRDSLLATITDSATRAFVEINYGPWDRLAADAPFLEGAGPKPAGANFYPADMTKEEFEAARAAPGGEALASLYTTVRRGADGSLIAIPYHELYADQLQGAAQNLLDASELADDPGLKRYLQMRAEALITDNFRPSDMAWMDMKTNRLEIVIGPIETYEDQLFGYKAAYEGVVLVKDMAWSERLSRFAAFLPDLQRGLPVPARYRREMPGSDADLNAYDALFYGGDANSGSKSIAINLPNDEQVQLAKGTRRLQIKNVMRAKFDQILVPISHVLIAEDQQRHITFDAFFENTMFHEVAHGLGIKNTVNGSGTVREALKEHASPMEEGKADILGLYMVSALRDRGAVTTGQIEDNYVTFLAGIFRSVRFGASSAHGKANMVRFNFFQEQGAFTRDAATGRYRVNLVKMGEAVRALSELLLTLQGDGNYTGVDELMRTKGLIPAELEADLARLAAADIPVDVRFR